MTIDATSTAKTRPIKGTVHKRGYTEPPPSQGEAPPQERVAAREVTDRHKNSVQKDQKGVG